MKLILSLLMLRSPTLQLYWVDRDTVSRSDYHGANRKMITRSALGSGLRGLSVFQNKLYLPAWRLNAIVSLEKFQPSNLSM